VHEPEDIRRESHARAAEQRKNLDWQGIILMTVGLASLQYVLEEGSRNDWFQSHVIAVMSFVALFVLAAFVIRELTAPVPAVDLSLFKDRVFLSGTLIGAMMFAILMSITFLLPLFMQQLLGFPAMDSGVALMPRALAMMIGIPIVGRLYNYVQPRILVIIGVLLVSLSAVLMSHYTLATSSHSIILAIMIQGLGFASLFVPLTTVALAGIPRYRMTDATGLNSLLRQIGGSLGLAAFATLLPHFVAAAQSGLSAHVDPGRPEVMARLTALQAGLGARGLSPPAAREGALRILDGILAQQASVLGFERMFFIAGICFLAVIPFALLLRRPAGAPKAKVDLH
jgi:DHA2 family multidrug resistance protein